MTRGRLLTTNDGELAAAMRDDTMLWMNIAGRELEVQRRKAGELEAALRAVYKALSSDKDGEFWTARKYLDDRDIFNDDLSGLRVVEETAKAALFLTRDEVFQRIELNR